MIGKLNWLAQSRHPDFSYTVLLMSRKINSSIILDLHKMNVVLQKGRERESKVCFSIFGYKENLQVKEIGDT